MMTGRLILAIVSTILEEAALVVIVLWGLPQLDLYLPLPGLIAVMLAWVVLSITIYRMGSRALRRKPVTGLSDMVDSKGRVVRPLAPCGVIRIKSELWDARTVGRKIKTGDDVIVVGQDGLKLVVRKRGKKRG